MYSDQKIWDYLHECYSAGLINRADYKLLLINISFLKQIQ